MSNVFHVTQLVHFFQKEKQNKTVAFCHKWATKFSCTSHCSESQVNLKTVRKSGGNESSLLPHILFMNQAFMPHLATACVCVSVLRVMSVQISWFILSTEALHDQWFLLWQLSNSSLCAPQQHTHTHSSKS